MPEPAGPLVSLAFDLRGLHLERTPDRVAHDASNEGATEPSAERNERLAFDLARIHATATFQLGRRIRDAAALSLKCPCDSGNEEVPALARWPVKVLFLENHQVFAETVIEQFLTDHEVVLVPTVAGGQGGHVSEL